MILCPFLNFAIPIAYECTQVSYTNAYYFRIRTQTIFVYENDSLSYTKNFKTHTILLRKSHEYDS